ncbi:MAG: aminopeptidase P family protein [Planctomycetaceae bacterium]|nr:aminopeptidase P family protein [Planctomycetaceae bacterium]
MLTQEGCLARRQRLWNAVPENVDWLLIADPRHVQYLANFWVQPLSFSGGERGLLLLERSGQASIMGDNFAVRSAAHAPYVDREVIEGWYDHKHSVINRDEALFNALGQIASELKGRTGLYEAEWLPAAALQHLGSNASDGKLGSILRGLRRQKEPDEIALIKQCCRGGDAGQARLREILAVGISEFEIYREVQQAALAAAGRPGLVYGDFRAANGNQHKAGGLPTNYKVQEGDTFVLDYSIVLDGYRSDFTNTLSVGTPSDAICEMFALCQAGMEAGEATLKAGAAAKDVHAAVAGPYREANRAELFTHHAGHGIGLAHPESPILVPDSTDVLMAGDVVTLEPGAYEAGIGGMRIEHNYLITETGFERLSNHVISLT